MSALNALNTALFSHLSGGTALISALGGTALYFAQAPDGTSPPYVIWDWNSGTDENVTANRTKDETTFIRAYAVTPTQAGSIDALIDARLQSAPAVTGWVNFWTRRTADFSGVDLDQSGRRVYYAGGNYRIRLDQE